MPAMPSERSIARARETLTAKGLDPDLLRHGEAVHASAVAILALTLEKASRAPADALEIPATGAEILNVAASLGATASLDDVNRAMDVLHRAMPGDA